MTQQNKKFGGIMTDWCLQTLYKAGTEQCGLCKEEYPDMVTEDVYIFTGTVLEDPTGRWEVGFSMKSSLVLNVDRENGIIETANTIYKVQNEGDSYTGGDIGISAKEIYFQ